MILADLTCGIVMKKQGKRAAGDFFLPSSSLPVGTRDASRARRGLSGVGVGGGGEKKTAPAPVKTALAALKAQRRRRGAQL